MSKRTLVTLFVVAFVLRLALAFGTGLVHRTALTEMEGIAWNLEGLGHYGLYYSPTAYSTPPFVVFLAIVFKILGTGTAARLVCVTVACAASALRCALVPQFAFEAGLGRGTALLTGWLGVFYIAALDTEVNGGLDGPYVALCLLLLIWGAMRIWRQHSWQTRTPWGFYGLCGFSALLNPSVLPVLGGMLLAGAVASPAESRGRYFRQAGLAVCGILLFLGPWAIRNEITMGSPIFTRSNFGTEFWVSNGPDRTFDHPYNYATYHPSQNSVEAHKVGEMGEVAYSRMRFAEAMDWVRSNPGDYLRFTAERIAAWWFPPHPVLLLGPKALVTLLAFAGLWLVFKRQPLVGWLFLITWVTFPDVYYLVQWSSRYRYPTDWQILLCASVALYSGWEALRARNRAARGVSTAA